MATVLNAKIEEGGKAPGAANGFGKGIKTMSDYVEKGINQLKSALSDTIEDNKTAAGRLLKRGRYAVEDGVEETIRTIKRNPVSAVAIAFAAGAVLSLLAARLGKKTGA